MFSKARKRAIFNALLGGFVGVGLGQFLPEPIIPKQLVGSILILLGLALLSSSLAGLPMDNDEVDV